MDGTKFKGLPDLATLVGLCLSNPAPRFFLRVSCDDLAGGSRTAPKMSQSAKTLHVARFPGLLEWSSSSSSVPPKSFTQTAAELAQFPIGRRMERKMICVQDVSHPKRSQATSRR